MSVVLRAVHRAAGGASSRLGPVRLLRIGAPAARIPVIAGRTTVYWPVTARLQAAGDEGRNRLGARAGGTAQLASSGPSHPDLVAGSCAAAWSSVQQAHRYPLDCIIVALFVFFFAALCAPSFLCLLHAAPCFAALALPEGVTATLFSRPPSFYEQFDRATLLLKPTAELDVSWLPPQLIILLVARVDNQSKRYSCVRLYQPRRHMHSTLCVFPRVQIIVPPQHLSHSKI